MTDETLGGFHPPPCNFYPNLNEIPEPGIVLCELPAQNKCPCPRVVAWLKTNPIIPQFKSIPYKPPKRMRKTVEDIDE